MNAVPARSLALAAIATIVVAFAVAVLIVHGSRQQTGFSGTPVEPPKTAPDFVLTGTDGRSAHLLDRAYPLTFLFFGYTHCPDECPLALGSLSKAYHSLAPAQAGRTRIVFVSVDPLRDTPAVLKRYVESFGARIVGLTGSQGRLEPVWSAYGIRVDPSLKEIAHGDAIYALDSSARIVLIYPPDVAAAELAADAAKLAL